MESFPNDAQWRIVREFFYRDLCLHVRKNLTYLVYYNRKKCLLQTHKCQPFVCIVQ